MESPNRSFNGWDLWKFIKGRKRMILTLIAGGLGLIISDSIVVATVSGASTEIVFALGEYYFKKYG